MEEQTVNQLDNLLLQLGIETRELAKRKDDLKQQIKICESNIQEKKDYITTTQKTTRKLDEEIQEKQGTLKFIKENTKNLRRTGGLLLQYEKTLEAELEKRQDNYNQDMKMFQERIDSYMNVFQQYKDRYCLDSLAQKLLKIQVENEEIERRIRATEGQIMEKEKELTSALGEDDPVSLTDGADSSYRNTKCRDKEALQTDSNESCEEMDSHQDPRMQRPEEYANDHNMIIKELSLSEENKTKTASMKDLSESQTDTFCRSVWTKPESGDQMHDSDQKQSYSEHVNELEGNIIASCDSEFMVETIKEKDGDDLEKTRAGAVEDTVGDGAICPPSSPTRMKAVLTTPTFSLNNSPISSPGRHESLESKSPAFVFSVNSAPSTPAFSRLGCDFGVGSTEEEASPFTFSSSYFSDKKSPGSGPKFSGFLFDEAESRQDEFSFSFGTESPGQSSSSQENTGPADLFPFKFGF